MKIIRNTAGRWQDLADLKSYNIMDIDSDDYVTIVMALNTAMEFYQEKGWDKDRDSEYSEKTKARYNRLKNMHDRLTDYMGHERTFNGKKVHV